MLFILDQRLIIREEKPEKVYQSTPSNCDYFVKLKLLLFFVSSRIGSWSRRRRGIFCVATHLDWSLIIRMRYKKKLIREQVSINRLTYWLPQWPLRAHDCSDQISPPYPVSHHTQTQVWANSICPTALCLPRTGLYYFKWCTIFSYPTQTPPPP